MGVTIQLSYSDVTVAHRDFVYNLRPITERVSTGGGLAQFDEEGLVDVVGGPSSFRTIPALVARRAGCGRGGGLGLSKLR
jgi:hypothetical protein